MELSEKLELLSYSAKYDASCASSGSGKEGAQAYMGEAASGSSGEPSLGYRVLTGVCHSWTEDGRCVSLLKVLFSNVCIYDCAYCVNRSSSDTKRSTFKVDELIELTTQFYRRNYIEGLFLSSGIFSDPDIVMEKLIETAKKLRCDAGFGAYIHMKIIPGTGEKMIREAGLWADRLSANIELPTDFSLQNLAPEKSGKVILGAMKDTFELGEENSEDRRKFKMSGISAGRDAVPLFAPAGQSTQLIVGASPEDDKTIINLSGALYKKYALRRVYYSAYSPVGLPGGDGVPDKRLPEIGLWNNEVKAENFFPTLKGPAQALVLREHRLYQADWLLRFYKFAPNEILEGEDAFLERGLDPKTAWAIRHLDFFPVEVNRASYDELLRVPGIGAKTGRRIIETRRSRSLTFENLRRIGVVLKRARHFITASGHYIDQPDDPGRIRRLLTDEATLQPLLFEF